MSGVSRRHLLGGTGALAGVAAVSGASNTRAAASGHDAFTFVFMTDTHLQPELDGLKGCQMAFRAISNEKADFVVQGGDHVFDALGVSKERANKLIDLYEMTEQVIGKKIYHTIGNHDCFGVYPQSGASLSDPEFGKNYFRRKYGQTYYSFEHKGVHFIVLDSIGLTDDRKYEGRYDAAQLAWLKITLAALPAGAPIIVVTHIPMVTAFGTYTDLDHTKLRPSALCTVNTREILALLHGHNILAVLQGHTHVLERVDLNGVPYITGGAVCGNWWHGEHLGTPEGYMVVHVENNVVRTEYRTYGFQTVSPNITTF
ncbi:metallophosphoesterase [Neokomagataea thailandica NBRC 106555]|uniref:Metallophosphoesterase n=2 Tax=Neokomagataea TaxID=1223423 RepID=A0A4Y6V6L6_9PROT|nr:MULTISPECIES: metallophosphoesterase [Neokomagataea]QDH24251.1 metallophosphoesterase [Neokomagataea tanensis]GBR52949.1 metallophosphoesterase [Neokomagataea thailandica NBRC 106555]